MPPALTHPGVYIEELDSGVHAITGVSTSITAFVGRAWRGPVNDPVALSSFADYERAFGGLWRDSALSYAVQQYFLNGGSQALVVRTVNGVGGGTSTATAAATLTLTVGTVLQAASPGTWGRNLSVSVDQDVSTPADTSLFNLTIVDDPKILNDAEGRGGSGAREMFRNVSMTPTHPRFVTKVLLEQSALVRVQTLGAARPGVQANVKPAATSGSDGVFAGPAATTALNQAAGDVTGSAAAKTGIYALLKTDLFNLLCIPPLTFRCETSPGVIERIDLDVPMGVWTAASAFCSEQRALLLVDAPRDWTVVTAQTKPAPTAIDITDFRGALARKNAAIYFPRIRAIDPLRDGQLEDFAPCGAIAGIIARTDSSRGVWKAPAGIDANLQGVLGLSISQQPGGLTDDENGKLNPLGINCLRNLPNIGNVIWGARTLDGSDVLASQWKYLPVRRFTLFLEESLFRGTQWVVFEPNDEPLWAQIRMNLNGFMQTLFRQGAFQGASPRDAYFVKCSSETTTQTDIDNGVVNIVVGFAPLKPAEFVVIKIQQIAQQAQV